MEIRTAQPGDGEIIAAFNVALAKESEDITLNPAVTRPGVEAVLQDASKGTYFVACEGPRVIGVLMITREWSDWRNGHFWWMQSVYVDKEFRSKGVFKSLYAHIVAAAKNTPDVCGLRLYVEEHNFHAQEVYLRLGMTRTKYQVLEVQFAR